MKLREKFCRVFFQKTFTLYSFRYVKKIIEIRECVGDEKSAIIHFGLFLLRIYDYTICLSVVFPAYESNTFCLSVLPCWVNHSSGKIDTNSLIYTRFP